MPNPKTEPELDSLLQRADDQLAVVVTTVHGVPRVSAYTLFSPVTDSASSLYLSVCDRLPEIAEAHAPRQNTQREPVPFSAISPISQNQAYLFATNPIPRTSTRDLLDTNRTIPPFALRTPSGTRIVHGTTRDASASVYIQAKKKYKPVAQKVRAVLGTCPEKFRIERNITGDPLASMPRLDPRPPAFVPTGRYTAERMEAFDRAHGSDFLWPEEKKLLHHFMCLHHDAFAWSDAERGCFKPEFFPPVEFPVLPHTPWVEKNIPIPPGLYKEVCTMLKKKIAAGVYEPSNSSYRSQWFCILKKDGKSLRIVHSLKLLNKVTI